MIKMTQRSDTKILSHRWKGLTVGIFLIASGWPEIGLQSEEEGFELASPWVTKLFNDFSRVHLTAINSRTFVKNLTI